MDPQLQKLNALLKKLSDSLSGNFFKETKPQDNGIKIAGQGVNPKDIETKELKKSFKDLSKATDDLEKSLRDSLGGKLKRAIFPLGSIAKDAKKRLESDLSGTSKAFQDIARKINNLDFTNPKTMKSVDDIAKGVKGYLTALARFDKLDKPLKVEITQEDIDKKQKATERGSKTTKDKARRELQILKDAQQVQSNLLGAAKNLKRLSKEFPDMLSDLGDDFDQIGDDIDKLSNNFDKTASIVKNLNDKLGGIKVGAQNKIQTTTEQRSKAAEQVSKGSELIVNLGKTALPAIAKDQLAAQRFSVTGASYIDAADFGMSMAGMSEFINENRLLLRQISKSSVAADSLDDGGMKALYDVGVLFGRAGEEATKFGAEMLKLQTRSGFGADPADLSAMAKDFRSTAVSASLTEGQMAEIYSTMVDSNFIEAFRSTYTGEEDDFQKALREEIHTRTVHNRQLGKSVDLLKKEQQARNNQAMTPAMELLMNQVQARHGLPQLVSTLGEDRIRKNMGDKDVEITPERLRTIANMGLESDYAGLADAENLDVIRNALLSSYNELKQESLVKTAGTGIESSASFGGLAVAETLMPGLGASSQAYAEAKRAQASIEKAGGGDTVMPVDSLSKAINGENGLVNELDKLTETIADTWTIIGGITQSPIGTAVSASGLGSLGSAIIGGATTTAGSWALGKMFGKGGGPDTPNVKGGKLATAGKMAKGGGKIALLSALGIGAYSLLTGSSEAGAGGGLPSLPDGGGLGSFELADVKEMLVHNLIVQNGSIPMGPGPASNNPYSSNPNFQKAYADYQQKLELRRSQIEGEQAASRNSEMVELVRSISPAEMGFKDTVVSAGAAGALFSAVPGLYKVMRGQQTLAQTGMNALRAGGSSIKALGAKAGVAGALGASAFDTYNTTTDDYYKRFGMEEAPKVDGLTRLAADTGIRTLGAVTDIVETASFGHIKASETDDEYHRRFGLENTDSFLMDYLVRSAGIATDIGTSVADSLSLGLSKTVRDYVSPDNTFKGSLLEQADNDSESEDHLGKIKDMLEAAFMPGGGSDWMGGIQNIVAQLIGMRADNHKIANEQIRVIKTKEEMHKSMADFEAASANARDMALARMPGQN